MTTLMLIKTSFREEQTVDDLKDQLPGAGTI